MHSLLSAWLKIQFHPGQSRTQECHHYIKGKQTSNFLLIIKLYFYLLTTDRSFMDLCRAVLLTAFLQNFKHLIYSCYMYMRCTSQIEASTYPSLQAIPRAFEFLKNLCSNFPIPGPKSCSNSPSKVHFTKKPSSRDLFKCQVFRQV